MENIACEKCTKTLFQTDGKFVYVNEMTINPECETQRIVCPDCLIPVIWERSKHPEINQ